MPAMQPGSGGPYSEQRYLRLQINDLKNDLAAKPMGPRQRKNVETELAELKAKLATVNAKIRQMKRSRSKNTKEVTDA